MIECCKAAGLPQGHIDRLKDQRLTSLAKLAFAAGQPGETPTDAKLKQLVQVGSDEVPVHVISATRQVVYEAQTLLMAQVRSLIERKDDESKMELAPAESAERASRQKDQQTRLLGVSLVGEAACSHQSYDLVMKTLEQNTLSYLGPSKFPSRQAELKSEKPIRRP